MDILHTHTHTHMYICADAFEEARRRTHMHGNHISTHERHKEVSV
jgi:hypothetical protein